MKLCPSKPANFSDTVVVFVRDHESIDGKELFTIRANQVEDKWLGDIATLLCAAPDLLEALEGYMVHCKPNTVEGDDAYCIARAAIARTKGKSQ